MDGNASGAGAGIARRWASLDRSTTPIEKCPPANRPRNEETKMNEFTGAVPILNVKNLAASIEYYVNKLGFEKKWEWPSFAAVGRGKVEIFLCQGGQGRPGVWVSIFMEDAMPLYDEYKKSGAIIKEPPMNFPWGMCEFLVEDLDGHIFRMGGERTGPDSEDCENTARSRPT
jgi:catechol 2,3-dioxygenase-like lactoylglutathione lyase family enzyme